MEICEKGEMYMEKGDDVVFDHTKIILRGVDGEYFYAKIKQRIFRNPEIDISGLVTTRIPGERIWPLADPAFTRAPDSLPSPSYLKRPKLLYYEDNLTDLDYGQNILTELEACETLRLHPHPNIAQYMGCVVTEGRVKGLVFAKYSITLSEVLKDGVPFDKDSCLRGIEAGVRHMHQLGLVHNDLNPANIMMDGDNPVIIDFDSCKREGDKLGSKGGTFGWALDDEDYARWDNDWYSFAKIQAALS